MPTAAAGATDIANVLLQLTGELPADGLEDVMATFRRQLYVMRLVNPEPQILLLVILDRDRVRTMESLRLDDLLLKRQKANMALARHSLKRIENDISV